MPCTSPVPQQEYILPLLPGLTGTLIPPDTPVPGGAATVSRGKAGKDMAVNVAGEGISSHRL